MEDETVNKIAAAVSAAVKEALKPAPAEEAHKEEKPAEPKPQPKRYEIIEKDGIKYVPVKRDNVRDVLETLNEIYHPDSHDFLSCPTCKPLFSEDIKKMGYEVKESKDGVLSIAKKKV
jgi:DNA replication initiation complex subunit (GINS family)